MRTDRFEVGSSIARRDIWFGKVWSAWPTRVLQDDGHVLTTVMWPGVTGFAPSTWVAWLVSRDRTVREKALPNLAARSWQLSPWTWQSRIAVRQVVTGRWFAVTAFYDASDHSLEGWYVDFERPPIRTAVGIDTRDLFLDLWVDRDFAVRWKDAGEYDEALTLGLVEEVEREGIAQARDEALALVESRNLLQGEWARWRFDASWALPELPPGVLDEAPGA